MSLPPNVGELVSNTAIPTISNPVGASLPASSSSLQSSALEQLTKLSMPQLQSSPLTGPASVLQLQQLLAAKSQYQAQMLHNNQLHQTMIAQRIQQLQQASKHSHALLSRDQNGTETGSAHSVQQQAAQLNETRHGSPQTRPDEEGQILARSLCCQLLGGGKVL